MNNLNLDISYLCTLTHTKNVTLYFIDKYDKENSKPKDVKETDKCKVKETDKRKDAKETDKRADVKGADEQEDTGQTSRAKDKLPAKKKRKSSIGKSLDVVFDKMKQTADADFER